MTPNGSASIRVLLAVEVSGQIFLSLLTSPHSNVTSSLALCSAGLLVRCLDFIFMLCNVSKNFKPIANTYHASVHLYGVNFPHTAPLFLMCSQLKNCYVYSALGPGFSDEEGMK